MSLLPDDASFHERVQDLFAAFRGRGMALSALDVELVDAWSKSGAPFEVVARGIRKAAEAVLFDAPLDAQGLRSLAACRRTVEAELKKYAATTVGLARAEAPKKRPARPLHVLRFRKLKAVLKKTAKRDPALKAAVDRLLGLADPVDLDAGQAREELALATLLHALPFAQRLLLLQQAREFVQKAPPMSASARRESRRLHRAALLKRALLLPALW